MSKRKKDIMNYINEQNNKVVEVTKDSYTLENGDTFEHTFEITDTISVEEFQLILDNAKSTMLDMLSNVEEIVDKDNE